MWPAPGMRAQAAGAALCRIVLSVGMMAPDSEPPILPTPSPKGTAKWYGWLRPEPGLFYAHFTEKAAWSRNLYRNQGQVRLALQSWSRSPKPFHLSIFPPCPQLSSFNAPRPLQKLCLESRLHFLALLMSKSLHLMKYSLGNLFRHFDEPKNPSRVHRNP